MRALIFGASGLLGKDLVSAFARTTSLSTSKDCRSSRRRGRFCRRYAMPNTTVLSQQSGGTEYEGAHILLEDFGVAQMQAEPVFLREDGWTVELPVNFEIGIIPRDCALVAKRVEGGGLVCDVCSFRNDTKAVAKSTGIHSMSLVFI